MLRCPQKRVNSTLLVYDRFRSYPEVRRQVVPIWTAIAKADDLQVSRLGLRYVFNVPELSDRDDDRDWSGVVDDNISRILRVPDPRRRLARAVGVAEYNLESCMLRFQFGMHNPDFPALLRQASFLLDYDCYREGLIDSGEVLDQLDRFNKEIRRLFRSSIGASLRGTPSTQKSR
jgi:uncharacterized protein (TIGR04255 family)